MSKRGLGKGLGALIPTEPTPARSASPAKRAPKAPAADAVSAGYAEIPLSAITANPQQPRQVFDEQDLAELVTSLKMIGLLQPIVVRPQGSGYELVAGERRFRAAGIAGWTEIPAIIRHTDNADMLRDALLENLHRANLNALEEAAAYAQMLDDFGCTQDELATRIGRSRPHVTNTIRLLKLPPNVQNRVASGVLSAGHARALLSLDDPDAMERMATRIVAEGLSVRSVEELIILGDADGKERETKKRSRKKVADAAIADDVAGIAERAADALETRVSTKGFANSRSRGTLIIECADIEDLRRIVDAIEG
jgi:ParB family chromosome partitioning protein